MTQRKWNKIVLAVVLVGIAIISFCFTGIVLKHNQYSVDQYLFEDGSKITVDWNKYEDSTEFKNVRYYYGYINGTVIDGFAGGWYMSAEQWYKLIYEKGGEDYARYCATLTEWRW